MPEQLDHVLVQIYEHQCRCSRQGQRFTYRPQAVDGVALVALPTCVETGRVLAFVEEQR